MADVDALLFTRSILDDYVREVNKTSLLNGITLLNVDTFNAWIYPRGSDISTRQNRTGYISRQPSDQLKEKLYKTTILDIANSVCRNGINIAYGKSAGKRAFNDSNFDIIVAVPTNTINNSNNSNNSKSTYNSKFESKRDTEQNHKLTQILGFLIAEKGECHKLPDVWSVNLICTRESKPLSIKGQILMGCYLHAIKTNDIVNVRDKKGILELASGFTNTAGFFSYYKCGYNVDLSLHGNNCFYDDKNLPMSIDLTRFSEKEIISMATQSNYRSQQSQRRDARFDFKHDYGFFALGLPIDRQRHAKIQEEIAELCNTLYRKEIVKIRRNDPNLEREILDLYKEISDKVSEYSNYRNSRISSAIATQPMNRSLSQVNTADIDSTNIFVSLLNSCYKGICENFGVSNRHTQRQPKLKITGGNRNTQKHKNRK